MEHWKQKLANNTDLKVGVCWQGNSRYSTPFLRAAVAAKSLAAHKFTPFGTVPGIRLYSLQKENGTEQIKKLSPDFNLHTFDDTFDQTNGRFMDTAAVIKNLDLVVDTSIAHLAGAIGTPVWVALPEPSDWRWMLNRSDSPWYPNDFKLFRQSKSGDWDSVIKTIVQELQNLVQTKQAPSHDQTTPQSIEHLQAEDLPTQTRSTSSSILHPLQAELAMITDKLSQTCRSLASTEASIDNAAFMQKIKTLYLLDQLHKTTKEKIAALEE